MPVLHIDPEYPTTMPLEAMKFLEGSVNYTEEVPIRVRWELADYTGSVAEEPELLVTTNLKNKGVQARLDAGDELIQVPWLAKAQDDATASDVSTAVAAGEQEQPEPQEPSGEAASRRPSPIEEACRVMARSLDVGEWERAQTHESLLPYLVEETREYAAAVESWRAGDERSEAELKSELGDLLLQVLFHAELAKRRGAFTFDDAAQSFVDKMQARAPYLFDGTDEVVGTARQEELWAEGKRAERGVEKPSEDSGEPPTDGETEEARVKLRRVERDEA